MHALDILRHMHAETKTQLRVILATADPGEASRAWRELQPILDLHEQLEDDFVYTPIARESGPGTPLGDWDDRHEADVAVVKQLIAELDALDPALPAWRMQIGRIADVLARHVTDEEGQIFGRVEQFWGADRLVEVGKKMQQARDDATGAVLVGASTSTSTASRPRAQKRARK